MALNDIPISSPRTTARIAGVTVAIAMAFGFYLRTTNLSGPSFNEDELVHVRAAESINASGRPTLPGGAEYRRALPFTRFMALTFRIAEANELTARMPSAVLGTLLIWLTFLVGARMIDRSTGVLAGLFVSFSPFMVVLSRFARMYTLHQCLYLLAFLQFFHAYEKDDITPRRRVAEFALAGVLLLMNIEFHEIAAFFVFGLTSYCLWRALETARRGGWRAGLMGRHGLTAAVMAVGGACSLAVPMVRHKILSSWTWVPEWAQATIPEHFFYRWFLRNEYGVLCYVAVAGALWVMLRRPKTGAYLVAHFAVPMALLSLWPLKQTRYMAHLFPLYLILLAAGFRAVIGGSAYRALTTWKRHEIPVSEKLATNIAATFFIGMGLLAISFTPGFTTPARVRANDMGTSGAVNFLPWREASAFLTEHAEPGDVVIASRPEMLLYYFGRVDYSIDRQADSEIKSCEVQLPNGQWLDNSNDVPYLETTEQFKASLKTGRPVWLALQNSMFRKDRKRLSEEELRIIESEFHREYASPTESIVIFRRQPLPTDIEQR